MSNRNYPQDYSITAGRVNSALERRLPRPQQPPGDLHQAMRYAVLDQGKRIRPLFTYATGEVLGVAPEKLDSIACAVELIHAYSLIHDDLPAMDDDDLRRGKPSTHKAFGEALAILAGDALQALAFDVIANDPALDNAEGGAARTRALATLAEACGSRGMAGGQALDIAAEGKTIAIEELEGIHRLKTGRLLQASVLMVADVGGLGNGEKYDALVRFSDQIGLAFQVHDDVLDVQGDTETLGKRQGADQARGKATYPALLGLEQATEHARSLYSSAMQALEIFGPAADPLRDLAAYVIRRDN